MGEAAIWDSGTWDQSKWDIDIVVEESARGGGGGTGTYNEERIFKARQKQREDALKAKNAPKLKVVAKKESPNPVKPPINVSNKIVETLLPEQDAMAQYGKLAAYIDVAVIEDQRERARIAEIERLEEMARIQEIEAEMRRNDDLAIIMMMAS